MTVSVTGTSNTATVGSDGTFTLTGVPAGSAELHFSGGGVDARGTLTGIADHEEIKITVVINGGTALLTEDDDTAPAAPPAVGSPKDIDGVVSGLAGACPAVTFTIGTTKVSTGSATTFSDGTCQQLANGQKAEVKGLLQADGSIAATRVESSGGGTTGGGTGDDDGKGDDDQGGEGQHSGSTDVKGTISGLTGSCPAVGFTLGSTKVTTDTTTSFDGGSCPKFTNGKRVEVKGTKQADGSVKASTVSLDD